MNYLTLDVYKCDGRSDCTNGGISSDHKLFIPHARGNWTDEDLQRMLDRGDKVAVVVPDVRSVGGTGYEYLVERGNPRRGMFGGNFAWSSDSRVRSIMERPMPIHDRFE
jgi:hypothetical protein